ENYQIEGRRHHPGLGEQPVDLAAVMRLMVEKMAERQVERGHEPISPRIAVIKRLIEHRVRDAANQVENAIILGDPRDLQPHEIAVKDLIWLQIWRSLVLDPRNPDPVGDQDMV